MLNQLPVKNKGHWKNKTKHTWMITVWVALSVDKQRCLTFSVKCSADPKRKMPAYLRNNLIKKPGYSSRYSYWLDERAIGVRIPVGTRFFSSPRRPDWLWGPPILLCNEYRFFSLGVMLPGVKLTTHLQLVPWSRKQGSIQPLPQTPSWPSA
jgi:hypothetical protein